MVLAVFLSLGVVLLTCLQVLRSGSLLACPRPTPLSVHVSMEELVCPLDTSVVVNRVVHVGAWIASYCGVELARVVVLRSFHVVRHSGCLSLVMLPKRIINSPIELRPLQLTLS